MINNFTKCSNQTLLQQNMKSKLRTSLSVPTVSTAKKYETNKMYVAKSISAIHDEKTFKNYTNCTEHIEGHRQTNFRQKAEKTVSDISELLIDHDYNRDELFTILEHALSLDESIHNNLHRRDMNIIDKSINRKSISSHTFLREKKLSKLRCSQFNHLVNQIFH